MSNKKLPKQSDSEALRKEVVSVGKYSLIYVIGRALSRAVGFFMIPVYTRFITATNYGAMELISILAGVAAMTISMGVGDAMSRFYYAENDPVKRDQVVSTIIIGFSMIALPIVFLFLKFSSSISVIVQEGPQYQYILKIAIATVWFSMLCEIGYTYLMMRYMAKLFVVITTAQLFIALSLNIYFIVFLELDILGIFYSSLITQGLTGIILSVAILKKVRPRISISLLLRLVRFGLPLVPSRIVLSLGFVSNRFFLRWFASSDPEVALAQVGIFSLGHKFGEIINRLVNGPFKSFWGPRRLDLLLSDAPNAKKTVARVCTYAITLTVFIALLLSAAIKNLIEIMADPGYRGAHLVVPFVALAYVALGLETHFITGILYERKTIWASYISVLNLGIVLIWNYLFVPRYGLFGAATSNLSGFVVRLIFIYIISQRFYHIPFELGRLAKMFITACALYIVSQAIGFSSIYATFLVRTGFVALFPFFLFIVGFYKSGELEFVCQYVQKGRKLLKLFILGLRPT